LETFYADGKNILLNKLLEIEDVGSLSELFKIVYVTRNGHKVVIK